MIINISNNPANPKLGNEWDTRELDIQACEFFENTTQNYTQIIVAAILTTKDWDGNITWQDKCVANSNDWDFDYVSLKEAAQATCEFVSIRNVIKAQACPGTTANIVAAFDAQWLFN